MKVFVEFVGSVFFVDLKLSQNPYMPTTKKSSNLEIKCRIARIEVDYSDLLSGSQEIKLAILVKF